MRNQATSCRVLAALVCQEDCKIDAGLIPARLAAVRQFGADRFAYHAVVARRPRMWCETTLIDTSALGAEFASERNADVVPCNGAARRFNRTDEFAA